MWEAKKHSDLALITSVLGKEKSVPQSDWWVQPDDENPDMQHCYVFGCPNGDGAYLQCLFDKNFSLIDAKIVEANGDICSCGYCKPPPPPPPKKVRKNARRRRHGRGSRSVRK